MSEFTLAEAMRAQQALRDAAGLASEVFSLDRFIGMLSDEIESLRAQGQSDEWIASELTSAVGKLVSADDVADHFAPADVRNGTGQVDGS